MSHATIKMMVISLLKLLSLSWGMLRILKVEPCLHQHGRCHFHQIIISCQGSIHTFSKMSHVSIPPCSSPPRLSLDLLGSPGDLWGSPGDLRGSPEDFQGISKGSPGDLLGISWASPGDFLKISWGSPWDLLGIPWGSPRISLGSP